MAVPNITYTEKFIKDGHSAVVSLRRMYDSILITNEENRDSICRVPLYDIFLKYREQFADIIQEYKLPERYYCKPKWVSLELYGTTELWLSLLRVNKMRRITEFNTPTIMVYNPLEINEYIDIFLKRENKI